MEHEWIDDLGYGDPNKFICTDYSCEGDCGSHECTNDNDDYSTSCPVCGDPIDWCTGRGEIGDPRGHTILTAHDDDDDHSHCHWCADCSLRNYWGTLKDDVSDDHCPLCERDLPNHYSVCPNNKNN